MRGREIGRRLARAWANHVRAWEVLQDAQRGPWEQEGPLRWRRSLGAGWELHGATVPDEVSEGR